MIVAVNYSSVNPCDRGTDAARSPKVLGSDIAGVVAAVEDGCTRLSVGDHVFGDIGASAASRLAFSSSLVWSRLTWLEDAWSRFRHSSSMRSAVSCSS